MYMYIYIYTLVPQLSATIGETVNIGGKRGWQMIENKKNYNANPEISRQLNVNLALDSKATGDSVCLTIHVTHSFLMN